jgi:hypothetical protein
MKQLVEWELAGETKVFVETCPSATLSTTNLIWPDFEVNPGHQGGKAATKWSSSIMADSMLNK